MGKTRRVILALWAAILLLSGCRSVKYVPMETVRTDSVYFDRWLRDSVYLHDSVSVNRWEHGDTVFVEKAVIKHAYKDRWRHDTISVVRADTVNVPYPVEKGLTAWERLRLETWCPLASVIIVLSLAVFMTNKKRQ